MPRGFPPVLGPAPRVLVLGTMPSRASLRRRQYYGHARNLFWPFAGELLGIDPGLDYERRIAALVRRGVALWDVARRCERELSSDATIRSVEPNDIAALLAARPGMRAVFFNGAKAEELFRSLVLPDLGGREVHLERLPSTSPANASMPRAIKLARWRRILDWL